jgi:hypothetical protein
MRNSTSAADVVINTRVNKNRLARKGRGQTLCVHMWNAVSGTPNYADAPLNLSVFAFNRIISPTKKNDHKNAELA